MQQLNSTLIPNPESSSLRIVHSRRKRKPSPTKENNVHDHSYSQPKLTRCSSDQISGRLIFPNLLSQTNIDYFFRARCHKRSSATFTIDNVCPQRSAFKRGWTGCGETTSAVHTTTLSFKGTGHYWLLLKRLVSIKTDLVTSKGELLIV